MQLFKWSGIAALLLVESIQSYRINNIYSNFADDDAWLDANSYAWDANEDYARIPSFQASNKNGKPYGAPGSNVNRFAALASPPPQQNTPKKPKSGGGGGAGGAPKPSGGGSGGGGAAGGGGGGGRSNRKSGASSSPGGPSSAPGAPSGGSSNPVPPNPVASGVGSSSGSSGSAPSGSSGSAPPSRLKKAGKAILSAGAVSATLVSNHAENVGKLADASGDTVNLAALSLQKLGGAGPSAPLAAAAPMGKNFVMTPSGGLAIPSQPNNLPSAPVRPDGKPLRNRVNQQALPRLPKQSPHTTTSAPDTRRVDAGLTIGDNIANGLQLAGHGANVVCFLSLFIIFADRVQ